MAVGITPILNWARGNARIDHAYIREVIGEFFATFVLCLFAVGGTCNLNAQRPPNNFDYEPTASVFPVAFGYFVTTLLFGGVSGAHVNPAISIGMAIAGRLSWIKLHAYILVQILGGYLGSLLAYGMFQSFFNQRNPTTLPTIAIPDLPGSAALFNATPGNISLGSGFLNEIVITAIFMMTFLAVKDMWNARAPRHVQGLLIGLVVIGLSLAFGHSTGVAINPIRDLCPRLAALTFGWDSNVVWRPNNQQWWAVGFFAPFIGAIIGSLLYIFIIGSQLRFEDEDEGELVTVQGNPHPHEQQEPWRATVFIPKLGRKPMPQQPMPQSQVSPYARVNFQHQIHT